MAFTIVHKAHHQTCQLMKEHLAIQFAGGNDLCPKTVAGAMEMSNDKANKIKAPPEAQQQSQPKSDSQPKEESARSFAQKGNTKPATSMAMNACKRCGMGTPCNGNFDTCPFSKISDRPAYQQSQRQPQGAAMRMDNPPRPQAKKFPSKISVRMFNFLGL